MQRLEANFPQNVAEIVLDSLTQWDKDVLLHVSGDEIPNTFEIHMGYDGISEAYRFPLSKNDGVATVKIPNVLLEQTRNIKAWIYVIDAEGCRTTKTISIPMAKREKPAEYEASLDDPQKDAVEQLIENTNELIDAIEKGGTGGVVDQNYNPESENAQSGQAVAEAVVGTLGTINEVLATLVGVE